MSIVRVLLTTNELDFDSAPAVFAEVRRDLAELDSVDVVLDLALVRFLDAAGMAEIVRLCNELSSAGGRLRLDRWTRRVGELLNVAGLLGALRVGNQRAALLSESRPA